MLVFLMENLKVDKFKIHSIQKLRKSAAFTEYGEALERRRGSFA
ncbi:MAG: hypothetical protein AB7S56_04940 [Halothiobacillaceae bacterium]